MVIRDEGMVADNTIDEICDQPTNHITPHFRSTIVDRSNGLGENLLIVL